MPETVLITGASSGIGKELARLFAADGCQLILASRKEELLNELAEELRSKHGTIVSVFPIDLTDPKTPQKLFDYANEISPQVDVLVNNAGFGALEWFWNQPLENQRNMIAVNVSAVTELMRLFIDPMRLRNSGKILNVASTAAFVPGPHMALYYATKAFVLSLSEGVREEHRRSGIRITCLCPGPTSTKFGERSNMRHTILSKFEMPAERVAKAGYQGMRRGKAIVVPGLLNKVTTFVPRFVPRSLVRWTMRFLQPMRKE